RTSAGASCAYARTAPATIASASANSQRYLFPRAPPQARATSNPTRQAYTRARGGGFVGASARARARGLGVAHRHKTARLARTGTKTSPKVDTFGEMASARTTTAPLAPVKPRLRGVSHQYAFFVSLAAGAGLVVAASS